MIKQIIFSILVVSLLLPALFAEEERPKIGLVLGGGGALGLAHIGVLQELEALQIPIDYIGGTSMGAIIAGMYASGMSPDEIEQQFVAVDWWELLTDRSSYQFLDYRRKVDQKRFMGMAFGLKERRVLFPPGVAYGQKLNNWFETLVMNSIGVTDFNQLNIPYCALATDLRSGESIVLNSGNLAQSMRASMAVPGAFTPVRMGDMVLVDGGILNNIPVEVVKGMGADIIIAVDVGASADKKSATGDFHSLGSVVGRTYNLMQRPDQEEQLALADVVISPDLPNLSASQFHKVQEIIPPGRAAAGLAHDQLIQYSVDPASFEAYLKKQRMQHGNEIFISDVAVAGNDVVSDPVIQDRIKTKAGPFLIETIRDDLSRIYGMGDFQTVTYKLSQSTHANYQLEYELAEKFWGPTYLHFGTKVDVTTDASALWSILLNYTRTQINPLGGEIHVDLEGGGHSRMIKGEWYQPVSWGEHVFLAPSFIYSDEKIDYYVGDLVIANIDQRLAYGAFDAGVSFFEYGEIRVGVLGGYAKNSGHSGVQPLPKETDSVVAATTHLRIDQLDDPVFPYKGYLFSLDGLFAFEGMGSSESYSMLELTAFMPFTLGPHTLTPKFAGGSSLGTDLPFYAWFDVGGIDSFAGYAPYQLRGNYYGVGSLSYRYELGRLPPTLGSGLFAMARVDAGNTWESGANARIKNLNYGALAGFGADTVLGACHVAVGKAEGVSWRFYFSIGNSF